MKDIENMPDMRKMFFSMLYKAEIIAILFVLSLLILNGCRPVKETIDTTIKTDRKEVNTDSIYLAGATEERKRWEEKSKETNALIDFHKGNEETLAYVVNELQAAMYNTEISKDSLMKIIAEKIKPCPDGGKLKVNTDGSYELSGIKTLSAKILELNKIIDSTKRASQTEVINSKNVTEEATTTEINKETKRGVTFIAALLKMWWLLIVFYIIGWLLPPKRIAHLIKAI
jgi:hypothetical protein